MSSAVTQSLLSKSNERYCLVTEKEQLRGRTYVWGLIPPLPTCVILGRLLNVSKGRFFTCREKTISTSYGLFGDQKRNCM